jgi:hypothetical protein
MLKLQTLMDLVCRFRGKCRRQQRMFFCAALDNLSAIGSEFLSAEGALERDRDVNGHPRSSKGGAVWNHY